MPQQPQRQQQRNEKQIPSEGKPRQGKACSRTDTVKKISKESPHLSLLQFSTLSTALSLH